MWTGYQAEDADMVPVNSQTADAEAVLLYPAGLDIDVVSSSLAAGSANDSDTVIADNAISPAVAATDHHTLPSADFCYNNMPQSSVTELAVNGE